MQSQTLTRYSPEPVAAPTRYQVGFDIVLDNGSLRFYPVTVYAASLADQSQASVVAAAEAMVAPSIAAEDAAVHEPVLVAARARLSAV